MTTYALSALAPRTFVANYDDVQRSPEELLSTRAPMGVSFECPVCRERHQLAFTNPQDGLPPARELLPLVRMIVGDVPATDADLTIADPFVFITADGTCGPFLLRRGRLQTVTL